MKLMRKQRQRAKCTEETETIDLPTRRATRFDDSVTDLVAVINDLLAEDASLWPNTK